MWGRRREARLVDVRYIGRVDLAITGWHQGRATTLGSWAGERARCSASGYLNDGLENGIMALAIGDRYKHELVEIKSADRPVLVAGRDIGPVSLLCRL